MNSSKTDPQLVDSVEKAGIYALDLAVPPGFVVSEVKGEGIDDWKAADGKLKISFASRVLGARKLDLQLEQANKEFPDKSPCCRWRWRARRT